MRFPIIIVIALLIINALIDLYIYCAIHSATRRRFWPRLQAWSAVAFAVMLIVIICLPKMGGSDHQFQVLMWLLFGYLSVYIPKIIYVVMDVLSRLPMLWRGSRWRWMSRLGIVLGCLIFGGMWWGALINRYQVQVKEVDVQVADLPAAFDGFRMAQISDLHVGTFGTDTAFVAKLVRKVNALQPDVIVFTGDIVNRRSTELKPFMKVLRRLRAPYGVYSVMGNHDYGDYSSWRSDDEKRANLAALHRDQARMGWTMLNNSTAWLRQGTDSIALIGVENVGDPPFHTYGDLHTAYADVSDPNVKILLSHNPSHWVTDIKNNQHSNIALTLSGHTHAMQIELLGLSPAAWRYPTWGGLYTDDKGQALYVNIGAGEVGFPARIGATPEITLFTLNPATK